MIAAEQRYFWLPDDKMITGGRSHLHMRRFTRLTNAHSKKFETRHGASLPDAGYFDLG